jgi:hypothetical protein
MKTQKFYLLFLLFVVSVFADLSSFAQCSSPPLAENTSYNGTVSGNANLNNGDVKLADGNLSSANVNGGILIISGPVVVSNLNMNSGTILITSSGVASLPGFNFNGNVTIINYGSLTFRGTVIMQNQNNHIYNATATSEITFGSNDLNFSSSTSYLVNNGVITLGKLLLNTNNGGVCMGNGSKLKIQSYINNRDYSITVPSGTACLSYSGDAQMNNKLTNTANLSVCPGTNSFISSSPPSGGYGDATLMAVGCEECAKPEIIGPLPVNLSAFWATGSVEGISLKWRTSLETNNDYFVVERSSNGKLFSAVSDIISGQKNSSAMTDYNWTDTQPLPNLNYYRLRQVDLDGSVNNSRIISHIFTGNKELISVYPNPVADYLKVNMKNSGSQADIQISVMDQAGNRFPTKTVIGDNNEAITSLTHLNSGLYIVKVRYNSENSVFKIIKK